MPSVRAAPSVNGVEREPGLTHTSVTPASRSVAKTSRDHSPMRYASLGATTSDDRLADIKVANSERERGGRDDVQPRFAHQAFEATGGGKRRNRLLEVVVLLGAGE